MAALTPDLSAVYNGLIIIATIVVAWPALNRVRRRKSGSVRVRSWLPRIEPLRAAVVIVLLFEAGGLASWAGFQLTFGKVHPDAPEDRVAILAGFAAFAIAAGGMLLPVYATVGAMLAYAGLTTALAILGGRVFGRGSSTMEDDLLLSVLAVVGMVLLVALARRNPD